MDKLKIILKTLKKNEAKSFESFLSKQKSGGKRKDLALLKILSEEKDYKPKEIIAKLKTPNKNAYQSIRKRLHKEIVNFIVFRRFETDTTATTPIMGLISLAKYLFNKSEPKLAWQFLSKAEKLAKKNQQYLLLNNIYTVQIENSNTIDTASLEKIILEKQKNKIFADEDEQALMAYALALKRLKTHHIKGKVFDLEEIYKILENFGLNESLTQRPRFLYGLASIVRKAFFTNKDFYAFEPFIVEKYQSLNKTVGFAKNELFYKIHLLYMIAHILYRNRKFDKALAYLSELENALLENEKHYFKLFETKKTLLKALIFNYIGKNQEAIDLLENLLEDKTIPKKSNEQVGIFIHLTMFYFCKKDFSRANKILIQFPYSDGWCAENISQEFVLKKHLIELIVQYELGNEDIALQMSQNIQQKFKSIFSNPIYGKALAFIKLIDEFMHGISIKKQKDFYQLVDKQLALRPEKQEDIQAIAYYCWLKSKIEKVDYYILLTNYLAKKW